MHARSSARLDAVQDLVDGGAAAVVGDLADLEQTRDVARHVNAIGRMDTVIHNAGVLHSPDIFRNNVVAPYLLTALIERPQRLVYPSSGMHRGGHADLGNAVDPAGCPPAWAERGHLTTCGLAT
ncbi:Rossmann-fold NAD(P)-binding domain-containing protein [Arthrobacter sp. Z1-9]